MKKFTFYKLHVALAMLFMHTAVLAQMQSQLYVVSGGAFSDPNDFVEITHFDPQNSDNLTFGTIYTQAVQDALIHDVNLLVTATDSLVIFDLESGSKLAATAVYGANLLTVSAENIFMSVQYPQASGFLKIYDRNTLELKQTVDEISGETAGLLVVENKLFIAVPGSYGSTNGAIAIVDPTSGQLMEEIDMGAAALGIYDLYLFNDQLIALCKTPYGESIGNLIRFDPETNAFEHFSFNHAFGKGIAIIESKLYLMVDNGVGIIDLESMQMLDSQFISDPGSSNYIYFSDIVFDSIHQQFYAATTDYFSFGEGIIMDMQANITGSFDAGISAEALAVDYKQTTSLPLVEINSVQLYPNPAENLLQLKSISNRTIQTVSILHVSGQLAVEQQINAKNTTLNVSVLPSGFYLIDILFEDQSHSIKQFVKN
ncbi:MAG: T9SS type A sorting domain-containing protein [Bacteroidetes bacterium]|jgi:hypothetical protein|nr:T9SS type A sorting domain-containing protein [Bacteroidota bacterium]